MKTQQSVNLMEGLLDEMNRVRELIITYKLLPKQAGLYAAAFMVFDIEKAEKAIATLDTIQMIASYKSLKEYE